MFRNKFLRGIALFLTACLVPLVGSLNHVIMVQLTKKTRNIKIENSFPGQEGYL